MHYAQIDPTTRLCIAVSTLSAEVHAPHLIPIDSPDRALLGRRWDGAQWQAPPPPPPPAPSVPTTVTRAQGKVALIDAGLWPAVLAYVAAIADDTLRARAEVALHDTIEWRRDSPFLADAAASVGLTTAQLDALFIAAAQVML